jgi:hypothetical protein
MPRWNNVVVISTDRGGKRISRSISKNKPVMPAGLSEAFIPKEGVAINS